MQLHVRSHQQHGNYHAMKNRGSILLCVVLTPVDWLVVIEGHTMI